jgi:hypothetical protein
MNPENFYFYFSSNDFTNRALADDAMVVTRFFFFFFFFFSRFQNVGKILRTKYYTSVRGKKKD